MSTIKVNNIVPPNVGEGVTIDGLQMPTAGPLSNRNLIINGAMQVSQRGTSNTGQTATAYRACDRFFELLSGLGTWTVEQSTDAPVGFSNSLKLTCTTADASPNAGDAALISQKIEAQNLQHLSYGTINAAKTIVSFWVKSNKTGDASFDILAPDGGNRLFSQSYNISAADTWEYKTIEIPGDTAGTIDNNNESGFNVEWWLNSGSDFNSGSHQTSWGALDQTARNASNLGVGGAVNDYFQITGVQLEVGSKATPFEHESYGQTLAKCQRYCYRVDGSANGYLCSIAGYDGNQAIGALVFPVTMRNPPTQLITTGTAADYGVVMGNTISNSTSVPVINTATNNSSGINFFAAGDCTIGKAGHGRLIGSSAYLVFHGASEL